MAEYDDRTRFIPYRKAEVVELLCEDGRLPAEDVEKFRSLTKLVEALFHFEFHEKLETLKDAYFPFNPDSDVQTSRTFSDEEMRDQSHILAEALTSVLDDANYEEIPEDRIQEALEQDSPFSLNLHIDFDDFEEALVYARGETIKQQEIRKWLIKKETVDVPTYERVALFIRFKGDDHFDPKRRKKLQFDPGSTIVKLFKDIPQADLEMLFPNTQVLMKTKDKLLLGVPAIVGAIPILVAKVLPVLPALIGIVLVLLGIREWKGGDDMMKSFMQAAVGLGVLGGYGFRQWTKYKNRRIVFLKALADNLYFRNLDNNAGVFHHLVDAAEEEECKEAFLAYYFLLADGPATEPDLDDKIEQWFESKHGAQIDFEVDDALAKLAKLEIGSEGADGVWNVLPLDAACERVDYIWDNFFQFNNGGEQAPAS